MAKTEIRKLIRKTPISSLKRNLQQHFLLLLSFKHFKMVLSLYFLYSLVLFVFWPRFFSSIHQRFDTFALLENSIFFRSNHHKWKRLSIKEMAKSYSDCFTIHTLMLFSLTIWRAHILPFITAEHLPLIY